jgi:integrative and conjugative element protein (TIGR02256 family)
MKLLLTKKAYRSIVKECTSFPEVETGGILIGKKVDDCNFAVLFTIGSGPKAVRCRTRFSPDEEWQQKMLERLFERYRINYIGSYHSHPGFYSQPSHLDYKNAREITFSPDWNAPEAVFPIVLLNGRGIQIYPYYFSRNSEGFQPISQVVLNTNEIARKVLRRRIK